MTAPKFLFVAAAIAAAVATQSSALHSLTMSECSAKYKDSKTAGTLNGATWNDFRKSQCDLEMAAAGRRLLQPMRQEAEGRGVIEPVGQSRSN